MSEELKLITALCEALGFKVEIERNYDVRTINKHDARRVSSITDYPDTRGRRLICEDNSTKLLIDDDGQYKSQLIKPILSYKLIKGNE